MHIYIYPQFPAKCNRHPISISPEYHISYLKIGLLLIYHNVASLKRIPYSIPRPHLIHSSSITITWTATVQNQQIALEQLSYLPTLYKVYNVTNIYTHPSYPSVYSGQL